MIQSQIDEIFDIVAQKGAVERHRLTPEAKLAELNIASLDMVEIIFAIEDKFGVQLPFNANTNGQQFRTVADIIQLVDQEVAKKK
jgi:acyl carrier protein